MNMNRIDFDIQSIGEIKVLARLLKKAAISSDYKNLVRDCLNIADEMEYIVSQSSLLPSMEDIRDIFSIRDKGAAYILLKLLSAPGSAYCYRSLSDGLGYSEGSCKVFVSNLRKDLRAFDLEEIITTDKMKGILISEENADRIKQTFFRLNHWQLGHHTLHPGPEIPQQDHQI